MTLLIKLTDGTDYEYYDIMDYDDFEEMADAFISDFTLEEEVEDIWISCIDDEFFNDYEGLGEYYCEPTSDDKLGQGSISDDDWTSIKNDIEILNKVEDENHLEPFVLYLSNGSFANDLWSNERNFNESYEGYYRGGGKEYAESNYESMYGEVPTMLMCNINWVGVWEDMSDYWQEGGHIFRVT